MDNLNDIINNLSADDINMLKSVASSILSENENSSETALNSNENKRDLPQSIGLDGVDFDMIMKAKAIFEKMNSAGNKNVDLIMALKPHLSPEVQNKADRAMRILKLFEVLPLLRELF